MIWRAFSLLFVLYFSLWSYPQNPGPSVTGGTVGPVFIAYTGNSCSAYGASLSSINCTLTVLNTGDVVLIEIYGSKSGGFTVSSNTVCGTTATILADRSSISWASTWRSTVLYLADAPAGSCTVTLNLSGTTAYVAEMALDFTNVNVSLPINNTNCTSSPYCSANGSSTSPSASITTSNAKEMVVAFFNGISGSTVSGGSGYTFFTNSSDTTGQAVEYALQSSSGSYSPAFSLSPSGTWFVTVVALTQ